MGVWKRWEGDKHPYTYAERRVSGVVLFFVLWGLTMVAMGLVFRTCQLLIG
jgi:hypothetical protein